MSKFPRSVNVPQDCFTPELQDLFFASFQKYGHHPIARSKLIKGSDKQEVNECSVRLTLRE
jgi:hypothetical protein